jgi:hypothetical protein
MSVEVAAPEVAAPHRPVTPDLRMKNQWVVAVDVPAVINFYPKNLAHINKASFKDIPVFQMN